VTTLTPEQFAIVTRELNAMLVDGDLDEAWRVIKMFADRHFNVGLAALPAGLQNRFAQLGRERRRRYAAVLSEIVTSA